jgi:AraC-like DNA-binding protein
LGANGGNGEGLKRHQVEMYLATLNPEQLNRLTAREVTAALTAQGMDVSERYVATIFDEWKVMQPTARAGARWGSGARRRRSG